MTVIIIRDYLELYLITMKNKDIEVKKDIYF